MKGFFFLLVIITPFFSLFSRPRKLEVWFLSPPALSWIKTPTKNLLASNDVKEEEDMGWGSNEKAPLSSDIIKCDKDNYFDLYCGKSMPKNVQEVSNDAKKELSIWVDVSGSMREEDDLKNGTCFRRDFIEKVLARKGKNKVSLKSFDVQIRDESGDATLGFCNNIGLNDDALLIRAIEADESGQLVIITDITEMNKDFYDYLKKVGAIIKGEFPNRAFYAKDLLGEVDQI